MDVFKYAGALHLVAAISIGILYISFRLIRGYYRRITMPQDRHGNSNSRGL